MSPAGRPKSGAGPGRRVEPWLPEMARAVADELASSRIHDKAGLQKAKHRAARALGVQRLPRDPELLALLPEDERRRWASLLRKKPMRSQSGVAIVAVMSSPAACPHGKCVYCPGGPDAGVPQSYTGFEPSTMRAMRMEYDAYRIVRSRLAQLAANGHPIDKVEVVVQGGTFPARDAAYQDHFIASIYAACNDGPAAAPTDPGPDPAAWAAMDAEARLRALLDVQRRNEQTACRVVGLTVETKPDWCFEPHVDAMLRQGATRIELGIQTLDEHVTLLTNRGHTVEDAGRAMQVARDAGYKVCVHMMPGLPRPAGERGTGPSSVDGVDLRVPGLPRPQPSKAWPSGVPAEDLPVPRPAPPAAMPEASGVVALPIHLGSAPTDLPVRHFAVDADADIEDMRRLFSDPAFRPDMLKIYPTLVVKEGETTLKRWWRDGRFTPMDTEQAVHVVAESLRHVPEYCRIQRIDRDIPTTHVLAGVMNSNLRQLAEAEATRRGIPLRDIRAREIGTRIRQGVAVDPARLELVVRLYEASGGQEAFISLEDPEADALAGFVRVRRIGSSHRPEMQGACAVVRELKVYGTAQRLGEHDPAAWQHQGHGARLLRAAEDQAWAWGVQRIAVLAGPGVKEYYRRQGYADTGPYLAKVSHDPSS